MTFLPPSQPERHLVDDDPHTEQAKHEAIHVYDISLTSLEGERVQTADGTRQADMPHIWMLAMDPFAILERAILAEDEDPSPICAANVYIPEPHGTAIQNYGHCIRDWHHPGEHAVALE